MSEQEQNHQTADAPSAQADELTDAEKLARACARAVREQMMKAEALIHVADVAVNSPAGSTCTITISTVLRMAFDALSDLKWIDQLDPDFEDDRPYGEVAHG